MLTKLVRNPVVLLEALDELHLGDAPVAVPVQLHGAHDESQRGLGGLASYMSARACG